MNGASVTARVTLSFDIEVPDGFSEEEIQLATQMMFKRQFSMVFEIGGDRETTDPPFNVTAEVIFP